MDTNQIQTGHSADPVIKELKSLLSSGKLNPGDRLPSERKLAEALSVSRASLRIAIKRLEFFGILKTIPQTGTFVSRLDVSALQTLMQDALDMESYDLYSLAESRLILETNIIKLCCQRRTDEDLLRMEKCVQAYESKISKGIPAVEEDLDFHRSIADGSKNQVLKSMMTIITPDLMTNYRKFWQACDSPKRSVAAIEHKLLLEYISNRDEEAAVMMIGQHLRGVMEFARSNSMTKEK